MLRNTTTLVIAILIVFSATAFGDNLKAEVAANHHAYIPANDGRYPTVIIMPGCSGISSTDQEWEESNPNLRLGDLLFRQHYRRVAENFKKEGYAAFLVDVHSAEGVLTACSGEIPSQRIAEYIDGAIDWAKDHPRVQPEKIHLVGYSMGGRGVLEWLNGPRSQAENVKSAIAVYPGCAEHKTMTIPIPVLALLGGADDIANPDICEGFFDSVPISEHITVERYPGARHGFDIIDAPSLVESANGQTIGYQREAAEASWHMILKFLMTGS